MHLVVYHVQLGNPSLQTKPTRHSTKSRPDQLLALKLANASGLCRPLAQPISTIMLSRLRAPPPTPVPSVAGICAAAIGTAAAGEPGLPGGTPALAARPPPMKGFDEVLDAVNGTDTLR